MQYRHHLLKGDTLIRPLLNLIVLPTFIRWTLRLLALMMLMVGLFMLRVHSADPMSQWVAFTDEAFYNSGADLYRIRLDGLLFDKLATQPTPISQPSWSPNRRPI